MPCKAFIVCTTMAHVDTILEDSSWTPPPWGSLSKLYRRVTWTVFVSFVLLLLTLLYWIIPCQLYRRVNRIVYNIIRFITQIRQYFTVYFKPYQTVHYGTILKDALGTISSSVDCITLENSLSWHRPISGKLIHQNFMSTNSVFGKYRGMSYIDFWKTYPYIWMSVPDTSLCYATKFIKYYFLTECSAFDKFSRNRPVSCPGIRKLRIGWVFHEWV